MEFLLQNNQIETILSDVIGKNNEYLIASNIFKNASSNVQYYSQTDEDSVEIQKVLNFNDIPHKLIKQINSNEFYKETNRGILNSLILGSSIILAIFIIFLLNDLNAVGIIVGICLSELIFFLVYIILFLVLIV